MSNTITPVSVSSEFFGGPLLVFEISDSQALTLVNARLLPKDVPGSKRKWFENGSLIKSFRMPDGRVRLTISERLVRQRDAGFQRFLNQALEISTPWAPGADLPV